MIPILCPPTQTLTWMNHPWNFPSHITWSNNPITVISLAQMRQCNGCGNVRNDIYSTHTWDLVQVLESASPASCKTPATSIDSIHRNNHPRRNKKSWRDQTTSKLYCILLVYIHRFQAYEMYSWNPAVRELVINNINKLRQRRKNTTEKESNCTAWTDKREFST